MASADSVPPRRVLRLVARLNIGGPARHTTILHKRLRARGYNTLLVHGAVGPHEGSFADPRRDGDGIVFLPSLGRRVRLFDDVRAFVAILRLMRQWRPDVVHTHTAKAGTLGRLAAALSNLTTRRCRRCAIVHTYHGHVFDGYFGPVGSIAVRVIERGLAMVTDRVITISPAQRDDIVSRFKIAGAAQTAVVPLGLELDDLLQLPEREGRDASAGEPSRSRLGYVGRLVPIKDIRTLLEALAIVRRTHPRVELVIAGGGEERAALESLARERGLHDAVRFLGWCQDLPALYASLDAFVLSSRNEGTPVSLIEAMAAGVPAVATAVGGVPDVVVDGETGLLCAAADPQALAAAIVRCIAEPDAAARRARAAREAVEMRFGTDRLVSEVDALYTAVLAEKRGVPAVRSTRLDLSDH
jgi:glycosyltransferase involved in cell wall biosynthesis